MSLFAGIYSINNNKTINVNYIKKMNDILSCSNEEVEIYICKYFALLKFDFGAFEQPGYLLDEFENVTALAGEPILNIDSKENFSRFSDLEIIKKYLAQDQVAILNKCCGTYSICNYSKSEHRLYLATDKLGARPVYYYIDENYIYFSSCLKILEKLQNIPKRMDMKAFVEQWVFGVPLGSKTLYKDVKILRDGQYLRADQQSVQTPFYFRWDHVPIHDKDFNTLCRDSYNSLMSAVTSRCHRSNQIYSFLSGGLDSRCIVSLLNFLKKEVVALNCSRQGEQDQIFAEQYANLSDIRYIGAFRSHDVSSTAKLFENAINNTSIELSEITYPKLVFSGDGGSVGVGFVYMDESLFNLLKEDELEKAILYFLKSWNRLPKKIIQPSIWSHLHRIPFEGMKREIENLNLEDLERSVYFFLLRNDQRRHLHGYFEQIDQQRVELLIPFYDSRLLEIIAGALNFRQFLYHDFYHKWLHLFPDETAATPWQTYPGHRPCPVSANNEEKLTQWQSNLKYQFRASIPFLKKCWQLIGKRDFPDKYIRRLIVFYALLSHSLRLDNYNYIFKYCLNFYEHYKKCSSIYLEEDDN